jgi:hypothetical protein
LSGSPKEIQHPAASLLAKLRRIAAQVFMPPSSLPPPTNAWLQRARASGIHFGLSVLVAGAAALLVFLLWYPMPLMEIAGGRDLFMIVVAVDVVLGPVITFAVFDRRKGWSELRRDLLFVAMMQLAGLAYGLHTVYRVRPVFLALENDRLRVVRAIDLEGADLSRAPDGLQRLSRTGPGLIATRPPRADEKLEAIERGLAGEDLGSRPDFWLPPAQTTQALARAARPVAELAQQAKARDIELAQAVQQTGRPAGQLGFLPILARRTDWSALVDRSSGEIVGYVHIDGF